jgi:transketolase
MRTAFINQLIEEARANDKIFLLVGDLGYSVVEPFEREFPKRFLNVGIAEQNMTGVACGLAKEGYTVFTYSIGNFPTLRCMEQIRYDVCYHNLSVNIVAVGGGYAYGPLGVSHHTTEDLGMLRTIPNLIVTAPGDPLEAKAITSIAAQSKSPHYIRLGKAGEPLVHSSDTKIEIGKAITVIENEDADIVILSTGAMLKYAADFIKNNNLNYSLYSFPFIKPMDNELLLDITKKYKKVVTIEEHQRSAGFGSAILEALHDLNELHNSTIPVVRRIAIPDIFIGYAGTQEYLREKAGLTL